MSLSPPLHPLRISVKEHLKGLKEEHLHCEPKLTVPDGDREETCTRWVRKLVSFQEGMQARTKRL